MPFQLNMLKSKHILQEKRAKWTLSQKKSLTLQTKFAERAFGIISHLKYVMRL